MNILNLPQELIAMLPLHIHTIEDFMNLSSTCVTLRNGLSRTTPNQILRMAAAQRRIFFRPDPHFLIAATARQLSEWALLSSENTHILREAFKDGPDALLELCIEKSGITMEEIRRLHALRFTVLNPVADLIDRAAGKQWYDVPNFWEGGRSDAGTIFCEPERAMYQIITYGELFSSTLKAVLYPELGLPKHDLDTRLDYLMYCVPDSVCEPRRRLVSCAEPRGLYAPGRKIVEADQMALRHLLRTRKWREPFEAIQETIGPKYESEDDNEVHWKQKLWISAAQCRGFDSVTALQLGASSQYTKSLEDDRTRIDIMETEPQRFTIGSRRNPAHEFPHMGDEVFLCMRGYWQFD
ncbi:hypothetical protein GLAREA_10527 [Glarea lozoyensis ATCC 20868]|uniref:Uncharacterized protein n=1 Tax=Glarea lozoyensis (strain ATCC 20868 / MF5171) TaxID=1116229 RepID=S3D8Q2_GLAL2|nr:uncharacterized protein GLAREA_10527 [Glarea lozoyensis ATCC 20868]EPE34832.1 hypothetical protein GLAREA_10527 [Glarea lozoyensis ATCC 20868]